MSKLLEAYRLLGFKDLGALGITYSRESLARLEREGRFPKHVKLGGDGARGGRVAWAEAEVLAWIEAHMSARDQRDPNAENDQAQQAA